MEHDQKEPRENCSILELRKYLCTSRYCIFLKEEKKVRESLLIVFNFKKSFCRFSEAFRCSASVSEFIFNKKKIICMEIVYVYKILCSVYNKRLSAHDRAKRSENLREKMREREKNHED